MGWLDGHGTSRPGHRVTAKLLRRVRRNPPARRPSSHRTLRPRDEHRSASNTADCANIAAKYKKPVRAFLGLPRGVENPASLIQSGDFVRIEASLMNQPLTGGALLTAISTSMVAMLREHYGRGPMKAKTYAVDDMVVVVMRDSGFTPLERTVMDSGEPERVVAMRTEFQRVMRRRYRELIESLTGRRVVTSFAQAQVDPDITMEVFFVDRPLDGLGCKGDGRPG
jgi:uncharacterized protein YbcI